MAVVVVAPAVVVVKWRCFGVGVGFAAPLVAAEPGRFVLLARARLIIRVLLARIHIPLRTPMHCPILARFHPPCGHLHLLHLHLRRLP